MTVTVPYDWIKDLPRSLLERDSIPLMGNGPSFPWEAFTQSINDLFQTKEITLRPHPPQWRKAEELSAGIDNPVELNFNVEPVTGLVHWLLSNDDIATLMSWLLSHTTEPLETIHDQYLLDGFYNFLAIECCHLISTSDFDHSLTPKLVNEQPLPDDTSLCIDIGIGYQNKQEIRGRLILSNEFYQSWKNHYANRSISLEVPQKIADQIELTVQLEAGSTLITKRELADVVPGDFILLDSCSIQPKEQKGRVLLIVNGIPLFRGKLKQGNIKILELPLFYEVDTPMDNEEQEQAAAPEAEGLPAEHQAEEGEAHEEEHAEESIVETDTELSSTGSVVETKKVDLNELPVTLKIEVGRLHMSVRKLLDLQAGNLLEIDVRPEDGVDLVVNGKCIGKGELIRLGDALGVRILDLLTQ
jgi:flagellar motor switch protein FliN/FliY